jgi:alpha-tubulin suppressor-like RCC1 family protein
VCGNSFSCVVTTTGQVKCWGNGGNGRTGYGSTTTITDPSAAGLVSVGQDVSLLGLSLDGLHVLALLDDASVKAWGAGTSGRLGYGNTNHIGDDEVPSTVGVVSLP